MKNILFNINALLIAAILFLGSSCKKERLRPIEKLPPATQEGLNTFGCLVNGQPWTPEGYNGTSNLDLSYDPGYRGGVFNLGAYRIIGESHVDISIYSDSIKQPGLYELAFDNRHWRSAKYLGDTCWYNEKTDYIKGFFRISKLDLEQQIISGTFEFTLAKPGCDTIRVTEGRFDMKI